MKTKFFTLIMSVGMVFSTLTADVPENGVNKDTDATETQKPFTYRAYDPPVPTPVENMKPLEVNCMAYIFSMPDGTGGYFLWAFDEMADGYAAGGKLEGHYYDTQVACTVCEESVCYATRCSHNFNNGR